jgi:hypothetical protein
VEGTFDDAQLARLQEAAEGCRISRAMKVPVQVPVRRAPGRESAPLSVQPGGEIPRKTSLKTPYCT